MPAEEDERMQWRDYAVGKYPHSHPLEELRSYADQHSHASGDTRFKCPVKGFSREGIMQNAFTRLTCP
jgi:hypothetical protein